MDERLRSRVEEIVEEKVEESLKGGADSEISKIVEQKVEEKLEDRKKTAEKEPDLVDSGDMDRRSFLKMLGLGGAGLGLAASGAARLNIRDNTDIHGNIDTNGNTITDSTGQPVNINADQLDGKHANQIGSGLEPIKARDEAMDFTEDYIQVTRDSSKTNLSNGSISLVNGGDVINQASFSKDKNDVGPGGDVYGLQDSGNFDLTGVGSVELDFSAYLYYRTDEIDVSASVGGTTIIDTTLAGRSAENSGVSTSASADIDPSGNTNVSVNAEANGKSNDISFNFDFLAANQFQGTVDIMFNQEPVEINKYEMATVRKTLDGAGIQVDIIDSNGNVIRSDIQPITDIGDIDPSRNLGFRATINRDSASKNPSLDYLARRYTR